MANRTHYLQFYIHLTDKATFNAAVASVAGSAGWLIGQSPDAVAATYGAPRVIPGPAQTFFPPCITSAFFGTEANYPADVDRFTRRSGGWFGTGLFADTHTYIWAGSFTYAGTDTGEGEIPSEPTPGLMSVRRWVDGFENGAACGSAASSAQARFSPMASRHIDGFGFPCRNGQSLSVSHSITESGAAAANRGWDRFYIRLRRAPISSQTFWEMVGAISSQAGIRLRMSVGGTIEIVNVDAAGTITGLGASAALTVGRWYKVDCLYRTGLAADPSFFRFYLNGAAAFVITGGGLPVGTGLTQVQNVASTRVRDGNSTGHNGAWDLDDWVGAELPAGGGNPDLFPSRDWNAGSKVIAIRGQAAAASNTGNWAGAGGATANDWRFTPQRPVTSVSVDILTTALASQRMAVVTDAARRIDHDPLNRGAAGISVGSHSRRPGAPDNHTIGLKLPSAGEVTATPLVPESTTDITAGTGHLLYNGNTLEPVTPMAGTELSHTGCSAAGAGHQLASLIAQVETIGFFHPEDYTPQTGDPAGFTTGIPHWANIPAHHKYADGPNAQYGLGAPALTVIHARTYVGTGTTIQLAFRVQPQWIWIRNTATHSGVAWFNSAPAAFRGGDVSLRASLISRAYIDPNFFPVAEDDQSQQTIIEICGNDSFVNGVGVTYECVAFCDPGLRFAESGAAVESDLTTTATVTPLNSQQFTPEAMFYVRSQPGNTTTKGMCYKGPGNAADGIHRVNAAALATAVSFLEEGISHPANSTLHIASQIQHSFVAFRKLDASGDPDAVKALGITSWVGDGGASRTVNLTPVTGRRPMWAFCIGSNGVARVRDATHTGVTSTNYASDALDATTGITAGGIDSVSVGSALNTNAITFDLFVLWGCDGAAAGNNGWGVDCENIPTEPVEPIEPIEPIVPIEPPGGENPCGTPNLVPTGTITQCAGPSTLVINTALSQIGVSKQLVSTTLNTEVSQESTVCRLHYDEDVRKCLRDFDWPFATRYLKLTAIGGPASLQDLVQAYSATAAYTVGMVVRVSGVDYYNILASTGQPVTNLAYWSTTAPEEFNGDWLYGYLAPTDQIKARRIVDPEKRRRSWDLEPPTFRVGSWGNNPIIYSNELNVELEYTHLSGCVAYQGDPLFRSALSWRHAHSIAPALSRDAKLTEFCLAMYQKLLGDARASGAQEQQQDHEGDVDWIAGR